MSIAAAGNRNEGERQAMEVAEEAREDGWEHPSFCAELFAGSFRWDLIYPFPEQSEEDKKAGDEFIDKLLTFLKDNLDPDEVDRTRTIPDNVMQGLKELGAFGIKIPKEYGGLGLSQTNYCRAMHAVASHCTSTCVLLSAHQSIGVPQPLKMFGTKEQKERWLPRLAKGEISAFALTEPGVGSDPAQMTTKATPTEDGWVINGEKLWTTNGPIADIMVVMAETPPKILPNGREKKQITAFVVEKNMPGVEVVHRCDFMGLKAIQNGVMRFNNVKVPKDHVLWEEGKGLKLALITLNTGRFTVPASAAAAARACFSMSREWAKDRVQWGAPIGKHELSAYRLLTVAGGTYSLDAVFLLASGLADRGKADLRIEASLGKLFASGLGWRVVDQALQLRGGRGYETADSLRQRGETAYPIERMMRDFRINTIIEGTSNIQRLFASREALDRHLSLAGALFNPKASAATKAMTLLKAAAYYAVWYPKQWLHLGYFPRYGFGWEAKYKRFVRRKSAQVARTLFHAMILNGPGLEKKQIALGRIVDATMNLYALSAVLSYYLTRKSRGKLEKKEALLARTVCQHIAAAANSNLRRVSIRPGKSSVVNFSKLAMNGDFDWLERDMVDIVGLSEKA